MVRSLGIDPGTKSFDLIVVDGEEVVWEDSIPTEEVAANPAVLASKVREAGEVDVVVGPSGYGTPVVWGDELEDPEAFALEVLLLTPREALEAGVRARDPGISVYKALVKAVKELVSLGCGVCFIPSVILLPTVPKHRKLGRLDMGTADKLAVTFLAIHDQSRRLGIEYGEVSLILVEMGYGYNAVIGVDGGRIVDGLGGTLVPMGFLTAGPLDLELVVAARTWVRTDVFHGGVAEQCGTLNPSEALSKVKAGDEACVNAFEAMMEWVERSVRGMLTSVRRPKEVLISGRLTRYGEIRTELIRRLSDVAPVRTLGFLPGARLAKEAAQGYAAIGEGIAGGAFSKLVKHTKILEAKGTVMDYVTHPRLLKARDALRHSYTRTLKQEALTRIL